MKRAAACTPGGQRRLLHPPFLPSVSDTDQIMKRLQTNQNEGLPHHAISKRLEVVEEQRRRETGQLNATHGHRLSHQDLESSTGQLVDPERASELENSEGPR